MAKLNGPLLSLNAVGQIGKTITFSTWKGLHTARQYVVPANPNTTAQSTHRAYLTACVAAIHAAQTAASDPFGETDKAANALWAAQSQKPMTWFNRICKMWIDRAVAGVATNIFRGAVVTPGASQVAIDIFNSDIDGAKITGVDVYYGTTPTTLINSASCSLTPASEKCDVTVGSLTTGVKYYFQFAVTTAAGYADIRSGIYVGTPT